MAKWGLFEGPNAEPNQEFEGDEIVASGEYVQISKGKGSNFRLVATVRLSPGQCVKEIPEAAARR